VDHLSVPAQASGTLQVGGPPADAAAT
ncbi:MAG: hypothetical protein JWO60_2046, partial [Frankiales bacterium]|nr:hypothetical protein [Frankiales bacterium]